MKGGYMAITWLTICNATKANIYNISRTKLDGANKNPLKVLKHPEGRMKGVDLITDKPGDYKARNFAGGGKFIPHTTPHEAELEHFAKEIASFLENERANQHFESLVICSDSHFQGILEKHLPAQLKQTVKYHIQKNYLPLEADKSHKLEKVVQAIQHRFPL